MQENVLFNIEPKEVFCNFEKISRIPRSSGNEAQISKYLVEWAQERNLEVIQEKCLNVIVKKPGTTGYEDKPPILLQAHMDMVCEKSQGSNHDFSKDPIFLKIDGDLIRSADETTLGADDGIGVAYCMALLESTNLKHPPLEVIFTEEEESTFNGASSFDSELFAARRMINIDHAVDSELLAGSCGGRGFNITLPIKRVTKAEAVGQGSAAAYKINLTGLPGGHSGEDIHRGNGNAIKLLTRVLRECSEELDIGLDDFRGGTSRLAIPREASAQVIIKEQQAESFINKITEIEQKIRDEYCNVTENFRIYAEKMEHKQGAMPLARDDFRRVLEFISVLPNGIIEMSGAFSGIVESSINVGIAELGETELKVVAEMRNGHEDTGGDLANKVMVICRALGAECEAFAEYSPWVFNPESKLREKALEVYEREFSGKMKTTVVHAGIEVGCFIEKIPEMDAISIGPNCWSFHSPNERMSISSVQKMWQYLKKLLEEL